MENVETLFNLQKQYFFQGKTKSLAFRIAQLKRLKTAVKKYEKEIIAAIGKDLGKSEFEIYVTELSQFYMEVNEMILKCHQWTRTRYAKVPVVYFPGTARITKEPYGVVLLIGPFNYPASLILQPLIGAIASGNCVIIKPSEYSMNLTAVMTRMIRENFRPEYISVCNPEAGKEMVSRLLDLPFDYIFFTGSVRTGKIIMERASKNLTPITLELGGKSPCIVDESANIRLAAKKIAWGKLVNCGQTCIAPDYVLVHRGVKDAFLKELVRQFRLQYGDNPKYNSDYCRIVNPDTVKRLSSYMQDGTVYYGGDYDVEARYVQPTVLVDVKPDSKVMREEIFGPILPVLVYDDLKQVVKELQGKHKPLALYIFTQEKRKAWYVINRVSSGGVGVNDVIFHAACTGIPFGGVGNSGLGAYHGKYSIDTFTHSKSVYIGGGNIDIPYRYAPYRNRVKLIRMMLK